MNIEASTQLTIYIVDFVLDLENTLLTKIRVF